VTTFFESLDFRRYQVDLRRPIGMDEIGAIDELDAYGVELGRKLLADETDAAMHVVATRAPRRRRV